MVHGASKETDAKLLPDQTDLDANVNTEDVPSPRKEPEPLARNGTLLHEPFDCSLSLTFYSHILLFIIPFLIT